MIKRYVEREFPSHNLLNAQNDEYIRGLEKRNSFENSSDASDESDEFRYLPELYNPKKSTLPSKERT